MEKTILDFAVLPLLLSTSHTLLQNLVLIVAIFWIGKKLGGTTNFKKIFSVLSYCFIPASIDAILIPVGMILTTQLFFGGIGVWRKDQLILILICPQVMPWILYLLPLFHMVF